MNNLQRGLAGMTMIGGSAVAAATLPIYAPQVAIGLAGYGLLQIGISVISSDSKEAKKMNALLQQAGYCTKDGECAKVKKIVKHKSHDVYFIRIPSGLDVKPLISMKYIFENAYKNEVEVLFDDQNYRINVYTSKLMTGENYPFKTVLSKNKKHLLIMIGQTLEGSFIVDLTKTLPHMIIGSTSGGGKSRLIKSMIINLLENYTSEELQIAYLDNKGGVEAQTFEDVKHVHYIGSSVRDTILYINQIYAPEMERRLNLLKSKKVTNIEDYNEKVDKTERLSFQLIVIDELYPFLALQKRDFDAFYSTLGTLMAQSRATGQHVILITQRPCSELLPTLVRANVGITVALRTANAQESTNLIGESGLEKIGIDNWGRGLIVTHEHVKFQSYCVPDSAINEICEKHKRLSSDIMPLTPETIHQKMMDEINKMKQKEDEQRKAEEQKETKMKKPIISNGGKDTQEQKLSKGQRRRKNKQDKKNDTPQQKQPPKKPTIEQIKVDE